MLDKQKVKKIKAGRRRIRSRAKIFASPRLRLSIHKTLKHIYVQIIDDNKRATIVATSDKEVKDAQLKGLAQAEAVGKLIAEKAKAKKISQVVFDKGQFKYHGRVKALAEGARQGGLEF